MPSLTSPWNYCRSCAASSGSNFYNALVLLPQQKRDAMFALYSFCRTIDNVVDDSLDAAWAAQELQRWRREVDAAYDGTAQHPIGQALQEVVRVYGIPQEIWSDMITGMEWDLARKSYPDFKTLERYCYYVAGTVGLAAIRIFGCTDPKSESFARSLGVAFQLTNILRDVAGDAKRGRVYIPEDEMKRFGVTREQILQRTDSAALRSLVRFQYERADRYFNEARRSVADADLKALTPALRMAAVYQEILEQLLARDFVVFATEISLPKVQKIWLALFPGRWLRRRETPSV